MLETCFQNVRLRLVLSLSTLLVMLTSYQFFINVSVFSSAYTDEPVYSIWRKLRSLSGQSVDMSRNSVNMSGNSVNMSGHSVNMSRLVPKQPAFLQPISPTQIHSVKKTVNKPVNLSSISDEQVTQNFDVHGQVVTALSDITTTKATSENIGNIKSAGDPKTTTLEAEKLTSTLSSKPVPEISPNSSVSSSNRRNKSELSLPESDSESSSLIRDSYTLANSSNSSLVDIKDGISEKVITVPGSEEGDLTSSKSSQKSDKTKTDDVTKKLVDSVPNLSDLISNSNSSQSHSKLVSPSYVIKSSQSSSTKTSTETTTVNTTQVPSESSLNSSSPACNEIPSALKGRTKVSTKAVKMKDVIKANPKVQIGGFYKPPSCQPKNKVAIIIPFRNRDEQLFIFLNHIHPFLQRQEIEYRIYVVNQVGDAPFNRASLLNIGYSESQKDLSWNCNVFHDVDLLPEDDRNLYICEAKPKHMSVAVNTMKYKLPYKTIFGGVTAISTEHFKTLNGYSNEYWGWGAEDDDMYRRIRFHNMQITRPKKEIARYTMIKHKKEQANKDRNKLLKLGKRRFKTDGLVNLKYQLLSKENERLYTNITVLLEKPKKLRGKRATDPVSGYTLRGSGPAEPPSKLKIFHEIRNKIWDGRQGSLIKT